MSFKNLFFERKNKALSQIAFYCQPSQFLVLWSFFLLCLWCFEVQSSFPYIILFADHNMPSCICILLPCAVDTISSSTQLRVLRPDLTRYCPYAFTVFLFKLCRFPPWIGLSKSYLAFKTKFKMLLSLKTISWWSTWRNFTFYRTLCQ